MLSVERIDLFYGAAQALRAVSLKAEMGRILTCSAATASASRRCCAPSSAST